MNKRKKRALTLAFSSAPFLPVDDHRFQFDLYTIPAAPVGFRGTTFTKSRKPSLKEFFDGSSFTRNSTVYKEYRDFSISFGLNLLSTNKIEENLQSTAYFVRGIDIREGSASGSSFVLWPTALLCCFQVSDPISASSHTCDSLYYDFTLLLPICLPQTQLLQLQFQITRVFAPHQEQPLPESTSPPTTLPCKKDSINETGTSSTVKRQLFQIEEQGNLKRLTPGQSNNGETEFKNDKEKSPKSNIAEWLTEEKSTVDHAKHTMEQPSPVSVLDAFYTEDTPSPVKKKVTAFNDDKNLHFKEAQDQARMNNLSNNANLDQYSEFNKIKLLNTDDATVNRTVTSPCEGEVGDDRYIEEIILASGCLRDLDRTTTMVQLHPTVGFINAELYHVLEKTKSCTELTDDGYNKKFMTSKIRRKLVFDTVNDVLGHKLLKELCSGIDGLQNKSEIGVVSDDDDDVINIINADVNKRSQDWDEYCNQVPGLVLDIERLIFKDLICEVVNGQVPSLQSEATM
ncbi:hypothetical protein L1987_24588 [Smallanthus sonchifolius]|uniref:Uncharacterized protein n=1 Tax=Smallanthus sonchifolius TaxID=185202 RepID=A0ACB9INH6_9ASTR|nr:hypothetical protein L1987_24588 [Smallanthus sonchifolius]